MRDNRPDDPIVLALPASALGLRRPFNESEKERIESFLLTRPPDPSRRGGPEVGTFP